MSTVNIDSSSHGTRIPELDLLKALAIVLMVIYHVTYDLREFAHFPIDYRTPFWHILQQTSALLFIFVSGISSGLSRHPLRHGLRILGYGLIITLITYLALPEQYVRFGILHFLGTASLILFFLRSQRGLVLIILAILAAVLGFLLKNFYLPTPLLLPLGIKNPQFGSIDYFPIFPYLSMSILGLYTYQRWYRHSGRTHPGLFQPEHRSKPFSFTSSLSKHSLPIYLVHQPLILGVIYAFNSFS